MQQTCFFPRYRQLNCFKRCLCICKFGVVCRVWISTPMSEVTRALVPTGVFIFGLFKKIGQTFLNSVQTHPCDGWSVWPDNGFVIICFQGDWRRGKTTSWVRICSLDFIVLFFFCIRKFAQWFHVLLYCKRN